jgi:prepilin-type N-terminal cleavage/methylation domain-containing protein
MKKKGFTLLELLVSVSLISIVVAFLFRLFVDLEYSNKGNDYSKDNQQTRAIILKRVQDDFLDYGLIGLNDTGSSATELKVNFKYKNSKTGTLKVNTNSVTYTDATGSTEKWTLNAENSYMSYNITCVKYVVDYNDNFIYIYFSIPLKYKKGQANTIDDLEFTYMTTTLDATSSNFTSKTTLGSYNSNSCNE